MLLASLLLSNPTTWSPIELSRLLALIATLGVYELILVLLAVFLIVKRGLARDAIIILILEAFFLADVGFLDSEIYQHGLKIGLFVSAILMLLTVGKFGCGVRDTSHSTTVSCVTHSPAPL